MTAVRDGGGPLRSSSGAVWWPARARGALRDAVLSRNRSPCGNLRAHLLFKTRSVFSLKRSAGVKVRTSVRPICEHCKVIKRRGVIRVICKRTPKHKQRQG